ncbi:MAG: 2-phosphosulfolactate phosphatase [Candidatus Zixiibacteriota bacterium]|nr:MAG: 2-phosphosulfolactate phosphatase [candidate division Zixibacteria bacterium]
MKINLYLTPVPFSKAAVEKKAVVVIDVLRSSTSICAALSAGAKGVIPMVGPGEAGEMWTKIGSDMAILAGERNGVRIENFQLGNSPAEFTAETVGGKFVIMTTTNGTAVFGKTYSASPVLSCALANISAVADRLAQENRDVLIACCGREGHFSIEDTLCGGMLVHQLKNKHGLAIEQNDASALALLLYETNQHRISEAIVEGEHARFLTSIGFEGDVTVASEIDSIPVLPFLKDGRLILEDNRESGAS